MKGLFIFFAIVGVIVVAGDEYEEEEFKDQLERFLNICSQDESLEPYKKCVDAIQPGLINPDLDYSSQEEGCESIVNNIQMLADKTEEADALAAQKAEDGDDEIDTDNTNDNQIRVVPSYQLNDAIADCRANATYLYSR